MSSRANARCRNHNKPSARVERKVYDFPRRATVTATGTKVDIRSSGRGGEADDHRAKHSVGQCREQAGKKQDGDEDQACGKKGSELRLLSRHVGDRRLGQTALDGITAN